MKKNLLTLLFLSMGIFYVLGQSPLGFNYQAVIRNSSGEIVPSHTVGIKISILQGSVTGDEVYSETFTPETNGFGLVNLIIGSGVTKFGDFIEIDWSSGDFFIKVELDLSGGESYTEMGTTQLLSVPYANYAFSGNPGASAYQVWLSLGNEGSEEDFINSLTGPSGDAGPSAYQIWLDLGNEGTEEDFINSLTGPQGDAGPSAYQVWLDLGNEGTEQDFINSISGTSSWTDAETSVSTSKRVGIGTDDPVGMLEVASDGKSDEGTPLFEVKNSQGETVFAVYENSVKVFINEDDGEGKTVGGFAVSGRTTTKDVQDILVVTPEKTRVYVDEPDGKTVGGFAVSGRTTTKSDDSLFFQVTPGLTQVFVDESSEKTVGGFAVSGRTTTKGAQDIFVVTPEKTRVYVDEPVGKTVGGFAVSGRTTTKSDDSLFFQVTPGLTQVFVDETSEKTVGGFAVSGRTTTKGAQDIFVVTPEKTRVYVDEPVGKTVGGFAVSGRTTTKSDDSLFFQVTPGLTQVFVDETSEKTVGGFAVSGRTTTKGVEEILHITPGFTRVYVGESTEKTVGGFAVSGRTTTKEGGIYDVFKVFPERTDVFIKPSPSKMFPDGFSISAYNEFFEPTELFNVSEEGTFINTDLTIVPKVNTTDPYDITQTSAVAGGNVLNYNGSQIISRGVVYSITPVPSVDLESPILPESGTVFEMYGGFGEFTVYLSELIPATTYYVRAFAINEEGLIGYGEQKSFTTIAPYTLTFIVLDGEFSEISNATITIQEMDNPNPIINPVGNYVFNVIEGVYFYSIQAPGYYEYVGEEVYVEGNTTETVILSPAPTTVTFIVKDQDENPVSDVEIEATDDMFYYYYYQTTNQLGIAVINPEPNSYNYNINPIFGYEVHEGGSFTVNNGDIIEIPITLTALPKYTVTFNVVNEFLEPSVGAEIYLYYDGEKKDGAKNYNETLSTDEFGVAVFENVVQNANYSYEVYHPIDGFEYNNISILEDTIIEVTLMGIKGNELEIKPSLPKN